MEGYLSPWGRPQSEKQGTNHSERDFIEISRPNTTKYNHSPKITKTDVSIKHRH